MFMTTHMAFDPYQNEESVAEVRHHWKRPFHFGAPDGIVVNMTKDQVWERNRAADSLPVFILIVTCRQVRQKKTFPPCR